MFVYLCIYQEQSEAAQEDEQMHIYIQAPRRLLFVYRRAKDLTKDMMGGLLHRVLDAYIFLHSL